MVKAVSIPKRLSDGSEVFDIHVYIVDKGEAKTFIIEADCEGTADKVIDLFDGYRILNIYAR